MESLKKLSQTLIIRLGIVGELLKSFWEYKLWWGLPIILLLLFIMLFLVFVGHTGIAAFIYPLF